MQNRVTEQLSYARLPGVPFSMREMLSHDLKSAVASWKVADASARAAENLLKQAWSDYEERRVTGIPSELVKQATELRASANERLKVAVRLMSPERPVATASNGQRR